MGLSEELQGINGERLSDSLLTFFSFKTNFEMDDEIESIERFGAEYPGLKTAIFSVEARLRGSGLPSETIEHTVHGLAIGWWGLVRYIEQQRVEELLQPPETT